MRGIGFLVTSLFLVATLLGGCKPKSAPTAQKPTAEKPAVDDGPLARQAQAQAQAQAKPGQDQAKPGQDQAKPGQDQAASDGGSASVAPADGDATPPGILPSPTDYQDPNEYARAVSQFAQQINTDEAPEYVTKMLGHMEKITGLMQKNLSDCEQLVSVVSAYMDENKKELEELRKQGDEEQAKLSPEDKARVSAMTMLLMATFAKDLAKVQMQFVERCPKQADSLADAMQNLGN